MRGAEVAEGGAGEADPVVREVVRRRQLEREIEMRLRRPNEIGCTDFVGMECSPLEGELAAAKRVLAADTW